MTILVGYIPTAEGMVALQLAIREAKLRQTSVEVVNVALRDNFADITFAPEQDLDAVVERLEEAGLPHHVTQVLESVDIAATILETAERVGAELIVVGLRRKSPFGMALLGSNAQRIILTASCPVLSVRPSTD
jgi:nucleotide-binding universal stress UspA family protein